MADRFSPAKRSQIMSAIKGRNTVPERIVKRFLRKVRIKFRSNVLTLPGTPDFILPDYHAAIFVHGCFWHGHSGCGRAALPVTNRQFWSGKIKGNKTRDQKVAKLLREQGWKVITIWQCHIKKETALLARLNKLIERSNHGSSR